MDHGLNLHSDFQARLKWLPASVQGSSHTEVLCYQLVCQTAVEPHVTTLWDICWTNTVTYESSPAVFIVLGSSHWHGLIGMEEEVFTADRVPTSDLRGHAFISARPFCTPQWEHYLRTCQPVICVSRIFTTLTHATTEITSLSLDDTFIVITLLYFTEVFDTV